jgi:uncharacterized protein
MDKTLIFETVTGSRAFGLAREGSDTDIRGVIVGPPEWYFGFVGGPEQVTLGKDHLHWEVRKFLRLAAAANPSILEVLWTDRRFFTHLHPAGQRLIEARSDVLSKRIAGSFGEYAMSQLKRIRTHRHWLLDPPKEAPTRTLFGLPERTVLPKDQLGAVEALIADGRLEDADVTPNFLLVLEGERRYRAAKQGWAQYRTWVKQRNPDRAALEAAHGYDTKHAQHLVRLLRMAVEALETGELVVLRPDRDELLGIRDGAWTYEELIENAEALHADVRRAAASSTLPDRADESAIDALCVAVVADVLENR